MSQKKNLRRLMSFLLAFIMALSILPGQALAVSANADPSTWPAPDSQYTTPGKNPMYIYLDYSNAETPGIRAGHLCTPGAALNQDILKATATTSGYVKYTCDVCGSWAQINVPALPASAFTINPAYQSVIDNGVEYTGTSHTVVHDIQPAYQRYVGAELTNNVNVVNAGTYGLRVIVDSDIYDNIVHMTGTEITIHPKLVPWNAELENRVYDGTSALTGKTASYTDVTGKTVTVPMKTYLTTYSGGKPNLDASAPVTAPITAGIYGIQAAITDDKLQMNQRKRQRQCQCHECLPDCVSQSGRNLCWRFCQRRKSNHWQHIEGLRL